MSSDAAPIPDLPSPYEFKKIRVNKMLNALYNGDEVIIERWWKSPNVYMSMEIPRVLFETNQDKVVEVAHAEVRRRLAKQ